MKRLRFGMTLVMLASAFDTAVARADDTDGRVYFAPMLSYTLADSARGTDNGFGGTFAVGKRLTKGLELELIGTYTEYSTKQGDFSTPQPSTMELWGVGGAFNIYLAPSSQSFVRGLFLHADVLRGQATRQPGPVSSYTSTIFDPGLGYDLPLGFWGAALRTEVLYRLDSHNRDIIGTSTSGDQKSFAETQINVGLRIPFGSPGKSAAEAPPEEAAKVVPAEETPAAAVSPSCQPPAPGQPISLDGCRTGDTIVLRGVNFEFGKAGLTVNAKALLDQLADALLARKDITAEIDGHTDNKGTATYNQKLSEERAASVKQYLVGRGIDAERLSTKGFGVSMPVADNSTESGRELNRRVELKVTASALDGAAPAAEPAAAVPSTPPAADAGTPAPPAETPAPAPGPEAGAPPAEHDSMPGAADSSAAPPPAEGSMPAPPPDSATPESAAPAETPAPPPAGDAGAAPPPADAPTPDSAAPPPADALPAGDAPAPPPADGPAPPSP